MRFNYFFTPMVLLPLCAFSQSNLGSEHMIFSQTPVDKYTIVKSYSNESERLNHIKSTERSMDFPTQIIRMSTSLENQQLTCKEVNDAIEKSILKHITPDKFTYNLLTNCSYDPETNYATHILINSYFDPVDDEAVTFLKSYLDKYNGSDFLGTQLTIESSKGLVVALSITAGVKKNPNHPPLIEYRQDRSNFYFKSNFEMRKKLISDIYENFYSDDPDKILPFLDKWVYSYAGSIYKQVLRDSNYVELQPERIFLMENGEEIFVSELKYYFAHQCDKYENHHCLKQDS